MKIIEWRQFLENGLPELPEAHNKESSMTIGVFDGVHLGHQMLIRHVVSHNDKVPAVVTFRNPDFKDTGSPLHGNPLNSSAIQTFEEKAALLEKLGIKILIVIDFSKSFKSMTGNEFLELLVRHGSPGFFTVGADFRCGHNLDTDAQAVKDFFSLRGIPAEIVPEVLHDGLPISSSRIRAALANGDTELAEKMLGLSNRFSIYKK